MRARFALRLVCYGLATVLLIGAGWCLLWVLSSSSMAFAACSGKLGLGASNARCRQPAIAGLLAVASLLGAVLAVIIGGRLGRRC